ncbi:helix-turn-helix transcriptional regulator [Pluralibacter gergoviae]
MIDEPCSTSSSEISVRRLLAGEATGHPVRSELLRCSLEAGMDLLLWRGHFPQPSTLQMHDDLGHINFSCVLKGSARYDIQTPAPHNSLQLTQNCHYITHTPGCRGSAVYAGQFEILTVSCSAEALSRWMPDMDIARKINASRYFQSRSCSAEAHLTAHTLRKTLTASRTLSTSRLMLQGQSLVMLSLLLDEQSRGETDPAYSFSAQEQEKLRLAKDLLLADLTKAPGIADLSRDTGLSVNKIKNGFRAMFNNSVYGLFQSERMQEAKRRLMAGDASVMTVAADMGYANASHFSAAFQKQFNITPSALKRTL